MATSGIVPRRPRCWRPGCLLLLCLTWLVAWGRQNSFVQGLNWQWHGPTKGQVRERSGQNCQALSGEAATDVKAEARKLTSKLWRATSANKLIKILDRAVDDPIFNFIHASAAYTQLATLKRRKRLQTRDWDSPVLLRLHARVTEMAQLDQLEPRQSSSVLWSIAQLSGRFSVPKMLLIALVKSLPTKANVMNPQDLSNILLACAQLKNVAPVVLEAVPAIGAQIPNRAKDMIPQELSNCLWAFAQLKDEVPEVLNFVPAIVAEIPPKIKDMNGQDLANNAEALVFLQESVSEVDIFSAGGGMDEILNSTAKHLNTLLPRLRGKDLSMAVPIVVWACAKAEVYDGDLLASVALRLGSDTALQPLRGFNLCALSWSYQVLDARDDFTDFRKLLREETARKGFSEADVQRCPLVRFKWNQAS